MSRAWHVLDLRVVKLPFTKLTRHKGFPAEGGFLLRANCKQIQIIFLASFSLFDLETLFQLFHNP